MSGIAAFDPAIQAPDALRGPWHKQDLSFARKPDAFAFAGPTHQQTEAQVMASINASPEE